jgi:hypothetical protein
MRNRIMELTKDPKVVHGVEWLVKTGLMERFRKFKAGHDTVSPVYREGKVIYVVDFREGMIVRNFMMTSLGASPKDARTMWKIFVSTCLGVYENLLTTDEGREKRNEPDQG